ncbi:MAG: SCP2 sterol-binding domain-containing protein [Myxococcota bacterium]|nr:SCP2 sterol-binding domain-containing protein [Myxococcota bacterium]
MREHFEKSKSRTNTTSLQGKEFVLQYGVGEAEYFLRIKDGDTLEIVKGAANSPNLSLHLEESDWRDYMSGKVDVGLHRFMDPGQLFDPKRFKALTETNGTLFLKLNAGNPEPLVVRIMFNGRDKPSATVKIELADWLALQAGKKTATTLFMTGKLKAGGDLSFVMKCQALM